MQRRARRARRLMLLVAVFVIGSLFAAVVFHVRLAEGQLTLDQLNHKLSAEQARYQKLRYQVAQASSPQAIVDQATQYGMVPAQVPPKTVVVPGLGQTPPPTDGVATTPQQDWEKVKPHLGRQG